MHEEADAYAVDKLLGSLEFAHVVRRIKPEEVNRAPSASTHRAGRCASRWESSVYTLALGKNAASPAEAHYLELVAEDAPASGVVMVSRDLVKELDIDSGGFARAPDACPTRPACSIAS